MKLSHTLGWWGGELCLVSRKKRVMAPLRVPPSFMLGRHHLAGSWPEEIREATGSLCTKARCICPVHPDRAFSHTLNNIMLRIWIALQDTGIDNGTGGWFKTGSSLSVWLPVCGQSRFQSVPACWPHSRPLIVHWQYQYKEKRHRTLY